MKWPLPPTSSSSSSLSWGKLMDVVPCTECVSCMRWLRVRAFSRSFDRSTRCAVANNPWAFLIEVRAIVPKLLDIVHFLPLHSAIAPASSAASPANEAWTPPRVGHVDAQTQAHAHVAMKSTQVNRRPATRSIGVQAGGPATEDAGAFPLLEKKLICTEFKCVFSQTNFSEIFLQH